MVYDKKVLQYKYIVHELADKQIILSFSYILLAVDSCPAAGAAHAIRKSITTMVRISLNKCSQL